MYSNFLPAALILRPLTSAGVLIWRTVLAGPPASQAQIRILTPFSSHSFSTRLPISFLRQSWACCMLVTAQGMRVMESWGTLPEA